MVVLAGTASVGLGARIVGGALGKAAALPNGHRPGRKPRRILHHARPHPAGRHG